MKKHITLILMIALVGCTSTTNQENRVTPESTAQTGPIGCGVQETECDEGPKADMTGYEGFSDEDHVFTAAQMSEVNQYFVDGESFVVYYGFSSCPWCKEAMPVLNDVAKEFDRRVIYVDVREDKEDMRVDENEDYVQLKEILNDYLLKDEDGNPTLYVPGVYFVKDGEVLSYNVGTVDTHDAKTREMTEEEKNQLIEIYRAGFEAAKK